MKKFVFLFSLFCIASCSSDEGKMGVIFESRSFIQQFIVTNDIIIDHFPSGEYFEILFDGDRIDSYSNSGLFEELLTEINDLNYNQGLLPGRNIVLKNDIKHIDILADKDLFNIPAGESLSEHFMLVALSPLIYIQSGYILDYNPTSEEETWLEKGYFYRHSGYHFYIKQLNEFESDNLHFIFHRMFLISKLKFPNGNYNFTVTCRDDRKEYTGMIRVII